MITRFQRLPSYWERPAKGASFTTWSHVAALTSEERATGWASVLGAGVQKRSGQRYTAVQLLVVLFGHKVLYQIRPPASWNIAVSVLPDGIEFTAGDLPQHSFQLVPL